MEYVILAWWTVAVAFGAMGFMADINRPVLDTTILLAACVFWPITAPLIGIPYIIYNTLVSSTRRIRADLDNRKVLREFNVWLAERNK